MYIRWKTHEKQKKRTAVWYAADKEKWRVTGHSKVRYGLQKDHLHIRFKNKHVRHNVKKMAELQQ